MTAASKRQHGWISTVGDVAAVVLLAILAKAALAEPFYIPSSSMEPTLLIGDELVATKYSYGYSAASLPLPVEVPETGRLFGSLPARGDVVVFRWPGDPAKVWVKRVIGLPGDRVQMRAGRLWINGEIVPQQAEGGARFLETLPGGHAHAIYKHGPGQPLDDTPEVLVPQGRLFVMGDNRDNSADSRIPVAGGGVGLLPVGNLVGRVDAVLGSWDTASASGPIWTWPAGLRLERFFTSVM